MELGTRYLNGGVMDGASERQTGEKGVMVRIYEPPKSVVVNARLY